jgi:hypothetical protein
MIFLQRFLADKGPATARAVKRDTPGEQAPGTVWFSIGNQSSQMSVVRFATVSRSRRHDKLADKLAMTGMWNDGKLTRQSLF